MRKEPLLSTAGFHTCYVFGYLMTRLIIWWYDDTSHEFGDVTTHRAGWRYDDISREFGDMLTHHMSLAMWWHMTSVWWC